MVAHHKGGKARRNVGERASDRILGSIQRTRRNHKPRPARRSPDISRKGPEGVRVDVEDGELVEGLQLGLQVLGHLVALSHPRGGGEGGG